MIKLIFFILIIAGCDPPTDKTLFTFDQVDFSKILSIESQHNSKIKNIDTPIFISEDYLPGNHDISPYPLIFVRKDGSFSSTIETEVVYHFSEKDSVLRLITYTWDAKKIGDDIPSIELTNDFDLDSFIDKFENIKSVISLTLGNPENSSDLISNENESFGRWKEKMAKWRKGSTLVELKLIFTEDKKRLGTHRIRTKIYWAD